MGLGEFFVKLLVLALGTTASTDVVKGVQRWFVGLLAKGHWAITGFGSAVVALLIAVAAVYGFDVDIMSAFEALDGFDPELTKALSGLAIWVVGKIFHNLGKTALKP